MWYRIARDDACEWCKSMQGQAENYWEIEFARHQHCKCAIINTNKFQMWSGGNKKGVWTEKTIDDFDTALSDSFTRMVLSTKEILQPLNIKHSLVDVKDEMIAKSNPGKGKVIGTFDDANKAVALNDTMQAEWIVKTFGGTIKPISPSLTEGIRRADSLWTSNLYKEAKLLEFKSSNGSKSSINRQLRSAKGQVSDNDIVLIHLNKELKNDIDYILNRIRFESDNYKLNNVIVKHDNKLIAFYKRKAK